ncbi:MAG TPA: XrtA system polysaccharide deacetylase, partial [Candidatus Eisenbacteria bacterium]|nr:XrtA system polysaccharide deacetylase [Candidatus Eisenbacteria bacterium]
PRAAAAAPAAPGLAMVSTAPGLNALTIDFEDWFQGIEIPHTAWGGFESRIERSGARLLALLDRAGVRGTFFVLGWVAERHPQLVRDIVAAGHEIGTHGWSHTLVYRMAPERFREELVRSLALLQDLAGTPVRGHRAPYFSITRASLWALDVLAECGVRYDSSVFPVLNYRYGIEDAPRWPYRVSTAGGALTEFPISTVRLFGRNVPIAGGAYFRIFPYAVTRAAFRALHREGHPVVFYLHPWEVDPGHPRIPLPRRIAATHYVNLAATERRLERLLREFRFAPMGEVLGVG